MKEFEEADYISIPSHFVYQSFLEEGFDADKLIKVPYGVDMTEFRQIPKKDDVFRVLFVGMLCLRKGLHYLLEAVSQLDLDNFELVLRGSVIDEGIIPFLEKYKEYYKIADFVPREDLHKIYSNSSVFVLPSLEEGLSMAIAEAMACGLPVIVSTNTGGEDIVRDGVDGFITPIRDVEAIKEKILFFYENEEKRKEMGNNAKERVKEFTWDRYGERIVEEYKKLLGEE
ncbi:MAG: glycosyltransferase family 4 protein [Methanosarcinales archaeon]